MNMDDMTVVKRLERLQEIVDSARMSPFVDTDADEVFHGLRNIIRDLKEAIEDDVRNCVHCGSPFTYRRSDGDIGCKDCNGIMPDEKPDDLIGGQCPECDGYLLFHSPEFEESGKGEMTEDIECENCEAKFVQRWTLKTVERRDTAEAAQ